MVKKKKFKSPYVVHTWEERNRQSIWVEDANGKKVAAWEDDDVTDMFESGFFNSRGLGKSVISYLVDIGIIKSERMNAGTKIVEVLPDFEVD